MLLVPLETFLILVAFNVDIIYPMLVVVSIYRFG